MKTYNLYIDRKCEVWKRDYIKVEAKDWNEAINKARDKDYEKINSEFLTETIQDSSIIEIWSNEPLFSSI